jgi:hypothetical protein
MTDGLWLMAGGSWKTLETTVSSLMPSAANHAQSVRSVETKSSAMNHQPLISHQPIACGV